MTKFTIQNVLKEIQTRCVFSMRLCFLSWFPPVNIQQCNVTDCISIGLAENVCEEI